MVSTRVSVLPATILGLLPLAAPAPAQVPFDGIGVGAFLTGTAPATTPGGFAILDPAATTTTLVTGVGCLEVNSLVIDPYDQTKVLLGGISPAGTACGSAGTIFEVTLSGTAVTGSTTIVIPGVTSSIADLVLDDDGNAFAGTGPSVYKVDRATGLSTLVATGFGATATANALAYDPVGNDLYVGATVIGRVIHVDPETGIQTPVNTLSVAGITGSATISGLTLSEDGTKVYACSFGTGLPGGPSGATWIVEFPTDPTLWPAPLLPLDVTPAIGSPSLNDIEIHGTKMFTASSANADLIYEIDLSLGPPHTAVPVGYFPGGIGASFGVPSQLAVNEFADDLTVFPRRPTAGSAVSFELALGGPPGDIGVIGLVGFDPDGPGPAPFVFTPVVLGVGPFAGVEGNFALPPLATTLAAGSTGTVITLGSARFSGATLVNLDLFAANVEIQ
jgi:hypothetical protein